MKSHVSNPLRFESSGKITQNRMVLAAMTNKQSHVDGTLSNNEINWLVRRAKGGFGIITTAAAHVSKDGQSWEGELGMFGDGHIDNLSILARSVHHYQSLIIAQLFHGGMQTNETLTGKTPLSASRIPSNGSKDGFTRPATEKDINRIINDFTSAALRCVEAGFDGIELHGAHGYLISQFLGKKSNLRTDEWGGDINGRSRFLVKILRSIKKNIPENFIVGVRLSPEINELGIRLDDSISLAKIIRDIGVDFIHVSCWDVFKGSIQFPNDPRTLTEWFVDSYDGLPSIISTGGVWSRSDADRLIHQGADLVGVGRVGIAYPDWAREICREDYDPKRPPFTVDHLRKAELSDVFIEYMHNWKGFVVKDR